MNAAYAEEDQGINLHIFDIMGDGKKLDDIIAANEKDAVELWGAPPAGYASITAVKMNVEEV